MNSLTKLLAGSILALLFLNTAHSQSAIADAAMQSNIDLVERLIRDGANVNSIQSDGSTALHWASYNADAEMAEILIKAGADPRARTRNGSTPCGLRPDEEILELLPNYSRLELMLMRIYPWEGALMLAARSGVAEAVQVLLAAGADVNAKGIRSRDNSPDAGVRPRSQ